MRMRHRQTLDARAHLNNGLLPIHMIRHADMPNEMTSEEATRNHFERIVFDWGCPGIRFNTPIESIVSHHLTWLSFLLTFRWFGVASDRPIFPVAQVNTDFIQVDADTRDMLKEPLFLGGETRWNRGRTHSAESSPKTDFLPEVEESLSNCYFGTLKR